MADFKVDLTNCDREPIHIPGKIQAHGFLVAVDSQTQLITYISENAVFFVGKEAIHFLDQPIEILGNILRLNVSGSQFDFTQLLTIGISDKNLESINPFYLEINGKSYNLVVTLSGAYHILEFEPATSDLDFDIQRTIGRSVSEILSGKNLQSLFNNASREIRKITGYDRIMIYKFGEDGHGEVIAEEKNEDLKPFLGLHYPASDIPKQARALYKLNLTRIIQDVHLDSTFIFTSQAENVPLDLTHSILRAVSPIHIQYLKNMGVASSFSISLIAQGELWGLIVCHNYSPRFLNYKIREVCKMIGQVFSSALEYREVEADVSRFATLNEAVNRIVKYIETEANIADALTRHSFTINDITEGSGSVFVFDNALNCVGKTPDNEQIAGIVKWLMINMSDGMFYTDRFPELYPPAADYSDLASGVMACMISKERCEFIIWFKPEKIEKIIWAGNPDKPLEESADGLTNISPRKSFENWTIFVKHTSDRWNRAEITAATNIREQIVFANSRKTTEMRLLNERLKIAYEERDTFSYTISHDLRTPLSSIKSYAELLLKVNGSLDEAAKKIIDRILICTDKMAFLITEILNYSKAGRADISVRPINMAEMINEIKQDTIEALKPANLEFTVGNTPNINGDAVMINQAFTNLINNAIKYSARSNPAKVRVEGTSNKNYTVYSISDNGIGIDIQYYNQVFELFKRMDNVQDFEGTGVGLAIVKRIIEKHHGTIWFESSVGNGAVFYMSFKN